MKRIFSLFGKEFHLPKTEGIGNVIKSLSITEKVVFLIFALIFVASSLSMLLKVNANFLVEIPRFGGSYREGLIGTPRFINPLLAQSETDRDLSSLVYSGLMRQAPDGNLVPDLASSVEISEDGMSYFFKIKDDAKFHDGKPVTSADVIFTILTAQDPTVKSPRRANWDGVNIEEISEKEIAFHLSQPYAPFLNNTTLGILPKHIWQGIDSSDISFSQFNTQPIGSGPYKIKNIIRNKSGIAESYLLESFKEFASGRPYIKEIEFKFYRNEEGLQQALLDKEIDAINSISPERARALEDNFRIERLPLPRVFAIFFNQSKAPVLINHSVREALSISVDKEAIIAEVLSGYGRSVNGPIPEQLLNSATVKSEEMSAEQKLEKAREILNKDGWKQNENGILEKAKGSGKETLTFSISTADIPELVQVSEKVVATWRSLGVDVSVKVFNPSDLNQNVIRPRKYDALLFGQIIGRDLDFYAFWHSSQRNDPGLNVADYANITVDQILASSRGVGDKQEQLEALEKFQKEIVEDIPAVFIYSPDFIYIVPENLKGEIPQGITIPADRFANVHKWYLQTDTVWRIFKNY